VVSYAEADFPLTIPEIQSIVLQPDQIARMEQLRSEGILTIERHEHIRIAFLREATPGIRRGLVADIRLPTGIFVGRATQYGMGATKFSMDETHYLVPIVSQLDPSRRDVLAAWINKVVQARRMHQAVVYTLAQVVNERYMATTGQMHATWRGLIPFLNELNTGRKTRRDPTGKTITLANWRDKLSAPPRSLKNYQPRPGFWDTFGTLIKGADMILLQGDMLPEFVPKRGSIRACGEIWETLPGDKTYT
jgi:hypothetical protein